MQKDEDAFRVLVVDDNTDFRTALIEYISSEGETVEGAPDGDEALEMFIRRPYDLIITDLNMPGLSGIELIRQIKRQNELTEFIIITGYASLDSAIEAVKIGAFDYIVKPFRMEEIMVALKNVKEKVSLKKTNMELFKKLRNLYTEIERYSFKKKEDSLDRPADGEFPNHTERIVKEIKGLEGLIKGRLLIDE